MAKINQIRRLTIIVNTLNKGAVPAQMLVNIVANRMHVIYSDNTQYTLRTLQRDFKDIEEFFGIVIQRDRTNGYYIADRYKSASEYELLLRDFELLSAIDADSTIGKYVLPEHRRAVIGADISVIIEAIRNRHPIEFDYTLFRHNDIIVHKRIMPYFLKESQQRWYLVGYDADKLKIFGTDRMSLLRIIDGERFARDESIDANSLFRDSFGVWNDPEIPVEEVIVRYDARDGAFVRTMPVHTSQKVLDQTEDSVTISLRLRITNDFVMELLSRSRSVEVLKPLTLRERIYKTCMDAAKRNKISKDEKK